MIPQRIETSTFQLGTPWLNQLHHPTGIVCLFFVFLALQPIVDVFSTAR
jgi:hypothetical protein